MPTSQALLLVGSPKGQNSTSASLGNYLFDRLRIKGFETQMLLAHRAIRDQRSQEALRHSVAKADLMVLSFPLYIDCLPFPMIRALEIISEQTRRDHGRIQRIAALANCGFPEAFHTETALAICGQFARETGRRWAGGLALGGGGVINGLPLGKIRRRARNVIRSLDLAADALAQNRDIPQEAVSLMARPLVPNRIYRMVAATKFIRTALRFKQFSRLWQRPFDTRP